MSAFSRSPCSCPHAIHICLSCGNALRNSDKTYMRGWNWRTRYSYLGGLATGIGGGNEGVECGKGSECLAAREIEKEVDCEAEENVLGEVKGREFDGLWIEGTGGTTGISSGRHLDTGGYYSQEVEGIGGVVKKKVKMRVRVGEVVEEYEDERVKEEYLGQERRGENRSWCGWCARVVLSSEDCESLQNEQ